MVSDAIDRVSNPGSVAPAFIGQATAVEQSRAVAEVHAAIVVAQQCPRDVGAALAAMRQSCGQKLLAERAFYRFPRGGAQVSGASVHLARELARCWGNLQYGVAELRRDDRAGISEMQAYAWDVQTNTRSAQVFIVPHVRGAGSKLTDSRDIYENNANMGSRRLREAIFAVLPPWFVEEAKELCSAALTEGDGKPLSRRVSDAVASFAAIGITVDQLTAKLGRPSELWSAQDVAQLGVIYKSVQRGEANRDDEFPAPRVRAAELLGGLPPARPIETVELPETNWPQDGGADS